MKLYKNILHSVRVICSLRHVILYVGTSISEEPTSCIFRVHLSTHVRRFAPVLRHHIDVTPSVEKWSFTFPNTTWYVPPDLKKTELDILPTEGNFCLLWQRLFPSDSVNRFVFTYIKDNDSWLFNLQQEVMSVFPVGIFFMWSLAGHDLIPPTCSSNHRRGITRIG
jgi:hypothetical protein